MTAIQRVQSRRSNRPAIARQIGDTARESDVLGNLGMAMLTVRQPECARELFTQELALVCARNDQFAEKFALERLGIAAWSLRDYSGALKLLEQALGLALQLGDRTQQANLLWHQGIQYAELGEREPAIARAEEAITLFKTLDDRRPRPTGPICKNTGWVSSTNHPWPGPEIVRPRHT